MFQNVCLPDFESLLVHKQSLYGMYGDLYFK